MKRARKSPRRRLPLETADTDGHETVVELERGRKPHRENGESRSGRGRKKLRMTLSTDSDFHDDERFCKITLWCSPMKTLYYFIRELPCSLKDTVENFVTSLYDPDTRTIPRCRMGVILAGIVSLAYSLYLLLLRNDPESQKLKDDLVWYSYWVFLGILSSVGLGTGLHTFLLYLGPFIAKVTMAAQACNSVEFPQPPYPDQIVCPETIGFEDSVTLWTIIDKIRWESLMWGFGTALGELPPYFMARAARISGVKDGEEPSVENVNQLLDRKEDQPNPQTRLGLVERCKSCMEHLVQKVGFWGILACASVPNPLFDLAGITCGHFLVPFSTFFGATLIGKAVIKAHLQMIFVILAFNEELLERIVHLLQSVPYVGPTITEPFVEMMRQQRAALHNSDVQSEGGWISTTFEMLVMGMVIYFVISIINGMAQSYADRQRRKQRRLCVENSSE